MIRPEDVELFRKGNEMIFDLRDMQGCSEWDKVLRVEQLVRVVWFGSSGKTSVG
jgi:hypothetical protein